MKLRTLIVSFFALAACTQATGSRSARLIGTHDLVLVSDNKAPYLAAKAFADTGWTTQETGQPSRFLFVTSADTNELRVLDNYPGINMSRSFAAAPNPLETLSIPVLDRPTLLAVDEGRNKDGSRVTGAYVYAARPGGAEVSVVSVVRRRQMNGRPFPTPAPVTALGAFMEVDRTQEVFETRMPATTQLFVATWDGDFAAVYRAALPTDDGELEELPWERRVLIEQTPITAMLVVAPLATRTLDGAPFCATTVCLALSTRVNSGTGGESFMIDPATGQRASLAFSGPIRKLVSSSNGGRIYGVLDEEACGGPACGGVVAVDVAAAVSAAPAGPTFPSAKDATGAPMPPLRTGDGLITGLTVGTLHYSATAQNSGSILQSTEIPSADGGVSGTITAQGAFVEYGELGAFSSSSGVITFFSGLAGSIIDWDARRSSVTSASLRLPGMLPDGGSGFLAEDGGALGTTQPLPVELVDTTIQDTFRVVQATGPGEAKWRVDISDGYLQSQSLAFVHQGQLPGLVSLATSAADGLRLSTGGFEARAEVGDSVRFETGSVAAGYTECGRSTITTVGTGFIEVADVPAGCADRVRFSVRAEGTKNLVAAADLEGYLGRFAPGETLTYNRPYILLPAGVVGPRTALTVNIPADLSALAQEGAAVTFEINGYITPYQVSLDTLALDTQVRGRGCYNNVNPQAVVGNMVLDRVPTWSSANPLDFRWVLLGVVPSANSTLEITLQAVNAGRLTLTSEAICYR